MQDQPLTQMRKRERARPWQSRVDCTLVVLLLLLNTLSATSPLNAQGPEPFRRDRELEGRDLEYNELSFLHRFTYRYRPAADWEWRRHRQGLRTTAGSVRGDELFVRSELRKLVDLDPAAFLEFRHLTDEDFDGRYDRTLTGLGLRFLDSWTLTLLANIVGEKEDIDTHIEAAWQTQAGRRFRVALVLTDSMLNSKGDRDRYSQQPYTLFADFHSLHDGGLEYVAWLNTNTHTRLERRTTDVDFQYDRYSAGARARYPLTEDLWLHVDAQVETSGRTWQPLKVAPATDDNDRRLQRRHWEVNAELHTPLRPQLDAWIGARYFRFEERDRRPQAVALTNTITRRETLVHCGVIWRVRDRVTLWPGLYGQFPNSRHRYPSSPLLEENDSSFVGKLAVPIEVRFEKPAVLTINPTFRIDDFRFGGGNVQLEVTF